LIITGNSVGISIYQGSNNNIVSGNVIESNSGYGINLYASNDNKIFNNNIKNNKIGIYAYTSKTNSIYSNNLIDNKDQAYDSTGLNSWDFDKMGNYWSDYNLRFRVLRATDFKIFEKTHAALINIKNFE
jgi:parallel beta-helix repeat protein